MHARRTFRVVLLFFAAVLTTRTALAGTIAFYDFRTGDPGWTAINNGSITTLQYTSEGMSFLVVGEDPHVWSPPEPYSESAPVRMTFRMRSTAGPDGEVFWGTTFSPDRRKAFTIFSDGAWHDYEVTLPALGNGARVRIDSDGGNGSITIAWVRTETKVLSDIVAAYDFTFGDQGWMASATGDVSNLQFTDEGMTFTVSGGNPHVWGPPEEYPLGAPARINFRMKSTADATGDIFWGTNFVPERSTNFPVQNDGCWHDYHIDLPPLGSGARVRMDPAGSTGNVAIAWVYTQARSESGSVTNWDFSAGYHGWTPNGFVVNSDITGEGWQFESTGNDPWLTGPVLDLPEGVAIEVEIRLRSSAGTGGQIFWGNPAFSESQSQRFSIVPDGMFHDYRVPLPALGSGYRFRIDPTTTAADLTLEWVHVRTLIPPEFPVFGTPRRPEPDGSTPLEMLSGSLRLVHYGRHWGDVVLQVDDQEVAAGHDGERVGFYQGGFPTFQRLADAACTVSVTNGELRETVSFADLDGANWTLTRAFRAGVEDGVIDADVSVVCDTPRDLTSVPWLTLMPGLGTFGTNKTQALLAGLEYLSNEPSSSQADITTSAYLRQVPAPYKVTFPLMAIAVNDRYLGVIWDRSEMIAPIFDTPDRIFRSGAHLLALTAPGVGPYRNENELIVHAEFQLPAGLPIAAGFTLVGGAGGSVLPAIQDYVALRGLPAVPGFAGGFDEAVELLAGGWAESGSYDGAGKWKHAVWPNFNFTHAADAIVYAQWLAIHSTSTDTVAALTAAVAAGKQRLTENDPNFNSGIVHSPWPMRHHVLGKLSTYLQGRRNAGFSLLSQFDGDGIRPYVQQPGKPDFSSTHFTNHANGYAAATVSRILEAAQLTGNASLTVQAIALLDQQTALYADTVPRGAQTWEVPLHTPDILAAGVLTGCYVMGYELTGREDLLDEARYWAWTGIPFIYLDPSVAGEIGPYATIPVLGATQWVAPVWFGLPVQWCGLVYRNWLLRLVLHDPDGPWEQVADGITASGLIQSWPPEDIERQGLLPDILVLETQTRDGPAINSGTLQTGVPEFFDRGSLYGFRRLQGTHWLVHAPGAVDVSWDLPLATRFSSQGWGPWPYSIHLAGVTGAPQAVFSGPAGTSPDSMTAVPFVYDAAEAWLIVSNLVGDAEFYVGAIYRPGDLDLDGMEDTWEQAEGLVVGEDDALLDADGDGLSNGEEFQADTQPTNEHSRLSMQEAYVAGSGVRVGWKGGVQSTQYLEVLYEVTDPNAWLPVHTNSPPTGITNAWTDAQPAGVTGFYRVRAMR